MRTTLIIDDHTFIEAKKKAAGEGVTLSEFVTRALRDSIISGDGAMATARFVMPVAGGSEKVTYTPEMLAELRDEGR